MTRFTEDAFAFYEGLTADNSKAYWTGHRATYDTEVRAPFVALLEELAPAFGGGRVSVFRPYRDVRFSTDKSPYKLHQGGFVELAPSVGYYMQLDADGLLIGGGFHAVDRAQTARYRAAVDDPTTGPALVRIAAAVEKAGFELGGDQVRTRPRGVPADHPRLDLMRREFLTAGRHVSAAEAVALADLVPVVSKGWKVLRPLLDWIATNAPPD
ncbi:DUF2461 domain-containing protein [Longispora sp. K20-0274]|uniref:DUF2461 domain-containing protein n=1 Tax=Longispora sp. K20-0274 TaxID=3088255 RepID=UPI00399B848E